MGIGAGEVNFVLISTFAVLVVLLLFPRLEHWIDHIRESRTYRITVPVTHLDGIDNIHRAIQDFQLQVYEHHQSKIGPTIVSTWHTIGSPRNHDEFVTRRPRDQNIEEFAY